MISFGEAVSRFYRNYVKFDGRASRAEYWWPVLMQAIVYTGLIIAAVFMIGTGSSVGSSGDSVETGALLVFGAFALFYLVNFLPNIAVQVRRFHDLDQTGWLVLVFAILNAIIGVTAFAQLIWFALAGTDGPNKYGPDPYGYDAQVFG